MASSFCSDDSRLKEYARRAGQGLGPEACMVDVLDWPPGIVPVDGAIVLY